MSVETYASWIETRLLAPRRRSDPAFDNRVARMIGISLANLPLSDDRPVIIDRIKHLPEAIRRAILRDEELRTSLRVGRLQIRNVEGLRFQHQLYWHAICSATEGKEVSVADIDGRECRLRLAVSLSHRVPWLQIAVIDPENDVVFDSDWRIELACAAEELLDGLIRRQQSRLELNEDDIVALVHSLRPLSGAERILATDGLELAAPANFYLDLVQKLQSSEPVTQSALLPVNLEAFPKVLGFSKTATDCDEAARLLLQRVPLAVAAERWLGVPRKLPAPIREAIGRLDEVEHKLLTLHLLRMSGSPVSQVNMLGLVAGLTDQRLRSKVSSLIVSRAAEALGGQISELFVLMMRWLARALWRSPSFETWSQTVRLAVLWSHGHMLFQRLVDADSVDPSALRSAFESSVGHEEEVLFADDRYLDDSAHPANVDAGRLVCMGIGTSLGDDIELPNTLRSALRLLVSGPSELGFPWAPAMYGPVAGHDSLGSYLAAEESSPMRHLFGREVETASFGRAYFVDGLKQVAEEPTARNAWVVASRGAWPTDDLEVAAVARECAVSAIPKLRAAEDPAWAALLISLIRFLSARGGDDATLAGAIFEGELRCVPTLSREQLVIFYAVLLPIARSVDDATAIARFAQVCLQLVGKGPDSDELLNGMVIALSKRLPARLVVPDLSKLLLSLRLAA